MTDLKFALLTDIHISSLGDHHDLLSGRSARWLEQLCDDFNRRADLDFVLITGDLFDIASYEEFEQFQAAIAELKKPTYIIPGNHDRRLMESDEGLTRHDFAQQFNPQVAGRPTDPAAQNGYWSISLSDEVQLIGLDSIRDEDWGGIVDATQIDWLEQELIKHADKLIILAVHHPLHKLAPIDDTPRWSNFVCDNGAEIIALLDQHPQVKLVLTGHHHLSKAEQLGQRLHLANPAFALYPCAYRLIEVSKNQENGWHIAWDTYSVPTRSDVFEARERMVSTWQEVGFDADFVQEHIKIAVGKNKFDRKGYVDL